jgi:hypothetical protein
MNRRLSFNHQIRLERPDLGYVPSPPHSILYEKPGTLYFTDEINHSLVCLDTAGNLLWHKSSFGQQIGSFRYPRGIDIGFICLNHEITKCIAVCDSWNNRIQFFTLDGIFANQWTAAGEMPFREVSDVRFISSCNTCNSEGFWIVLDRGNNRLCGIDPNANLLWQTGRMLDHHLSELFLSTLTNQISQAFGSYKTFKLPIYDPLFFPTRIFGDNVDFLFIQELGGRFLKRLFHGNLFPLSFASSQDEVWISADSHGLLSWNPKRSIVSLFEISSKSWHCSSISGNPIPSNQPSHFVWLANRLLLEGWTWESNQPPSTISTNNISLLSSCLIEEEVNISTNRLNQRGISKFFEEVDSFTSIAFHALAIYTDAATSTDIVQETSTLLSSHLKAFVHLSSRIREFAYAFPLASVQACHRHPHANDPNLFHESIRILSNFSITTSAKFAELYKCIDEVKILQLSRCAISSTNYVDSQSSRAALLSHLDSVLPKAMQELVLLNTLFEDAILSLNTFIIPDSTISSCLTSDQFLPRSIHISINSPKVHFREINQISLFGTHTSLSNLGPVAMAHTCNDQILVALQNANAIVLLDQNGSFLGPIISEPISHCPISGPYGLAVDNSNQVWISERFLDRIRIFKITGEVVSTLENFTFEETTIFRPYGLCSGWEGMMLLADTGNSRILSLNEFGKCTLFGQGAGTDPGEFRHPMFFYKSPCEDKIWVSDLRNHRIQELDSKGNPVRIIGHSGLGKNSLSHIESLVQFEDGIIAVDYYCYANSPDRIKSLKLFSPDGEEIANQYLSYDSRGMLVHHGNLLISDFDHNCIRVYERI